MKKSELINLIVQEINRLTNEEWYYGSFESEKNQYTIMTILQDSFGFDYEADETLNEYCLKATEIEIWQYYLDNIIPNLKENS